MVGIAFAVAFTLGPALGAYFASKDMASTFPALVKWGLNPFSAPALLGLVLLAVETIYLFFALPETQQYSVDLPPAPTSESNTSEKTPSQPTSIQSTTTRLSNLAILNIIH